MSHEEEVASTFITGPQELTENIKKFNSTACQTTDVPELPPICIERFIKTPTAIHMYTGLENYDKFRYVLATLGPAAYELNYRTNTPLRVSVENQFFLTLIKLRTYPSNEELSIMFNLSVHTVGNVVVTWINFMYLQWKEIDTWPGQDLVQQFIPTDFGQKFPKTRIILDGVEFPIQKPRNPEAQQATFSTYKNRNTLKAVIGASPGGLITHVTECYGGSVSDRALVERSNLTRQCDPGVHIMVDKGFNVQDIFAPYDIQINIPTFLQKRNQFTPESRIKDKKIASKRVHIERLIGLAKTYKILTKPLSRYDTTLGSYICFICFMSCNFRTCIVPKNA